MQSIAESRLLLEGGWLLLVILAVVTKRSMLGRHDPVGVSRSAVADRMP